MTHNQEQSSKDRLIDIQTTGCGRGRIRIYPCSVTATAWLHANFEEDYPSSVFADSLHVDPARIGLIIRQIRQANLVLRPLSALGVDIASVFHGYQIHYFPVSDRGHAWLRRYMPDGPWYNGAYQLPHTQAGKAFRLIAQAGLWVS